MDLNNVMKWRQAMEMPPQTLEQAAALVQEELKEVMAEINAEKRSRDKIGFELADLIVTAVGLGESAGIYDLAYYLNIVLESNYSKIMNQTQYKDMCDKFPTRSFDDGTVEVQLQEGGEWFSVKKSVRDGENFYTLVDKNQKLRKPHTYVTIDEILKQKNENRG